MMGFDATSLYTSAKWDENSVYPKIENGFAFKPHRYKKNLNAFNSQTFNEEGNESAQLKINSYNPTNLILQHLPDKGTVKNIEVNKMRSVYIIDNLTSIDICEIVKTSGEVIEIYEGVIYKENSKLSHLENF